MEKKVILHLIGSLETGGTENMLLTYAKNSKSQKLKHIVCTVHDRGPLRDEFRKAGIELHTLGVAGHAGVPSGMLRLAALIGRLKPAIVHSYLLRENLMARAVCRTLGTKLICGKRDTDRAKAGWKITLERATLGLCDLNISNSNAGVLELKSYGVQPSRAIFVPNGKDISAFEIDLPKNKAKQRLGLTSQETILGCVARLYQFKGLEYAIRAMPGIMERHGDKVRLVLVGEGEMRPKLEKLVETLGLENNVLLLGERSDIPEVLAAFDIFVFPSLREGMPGAVMEAMASGLPVVATNIDGNRELIENWKNGVLVATESPKAIANAVSQLLLDRKKADALGKAAKKTIQQRFSISAMVAKLDRIYEDF